MLCQRCHMMRRHNIALDSTMTPAEYAQIISHIRTQRALVLLVVDMLDFPHSIFDNLSQLIGSKRPLYIVINKVDLLPQDATDYLTRVQDMVQNQCIKMGLDASHHIKQMSLISAKTGYGVETLVSKLIKQWGRQGNRMLTALL